MERLLYGTAYYPEYMPVERMDTDMELMVNAGINVIRIAESTWSTWEPQEGVFDFSLLHRTLEAAGKWGLSVIVGTPTYAIPAWMVKKHPDVLPVTHGGQSMYGHRQNMDLTHPAYRFYCERIIRKLMEAVQGYDCIIGFQLDNETKPYDTCSPTAQAGFLSWLKEKYGTPERFNAAHGLAYWSNAIACWEDMPDIRGTISGSLAAEYESYQRSLVTEFLGWQRKIVDEYRRPEQFVTHNFDYAWVPFHSCGLQPDADQFAAAEHMTVAGCDIYHPTGNKLTGTEISFGSDLARGLKQGQNYLVLETQAQGPLQNFPYPGQLRLHAFAHLAGGANMVEYWHWHSIHNAIECYWKGILSHDLTPGQTYKEVQSIGRDFARLSGELVNLKRHNQVAVMVSGKSLSMLRHDYSFTEMDYNRDGLRWIYDELYLRNIGCDIVPDTCRDFSGYTLVVTPCLYCAEDSLIDALRQYVSGGGHLLATYRSFFADENGKIRHETQPYRMGDVFGLHYDQFCPGKDFEEHTHYFMELLTPHEDAQVVRRYENPAFSEYAAAVFHPFGQGSAGYIGADFDASVRKGLLDDLLPRLGIRLPETGFPVVIKEGTNGSGSTIRYVMNFSAEEQTYTVPGGCLELVSKTPMEGGQQLTLPAWGFAVLKF